MQEWMKIHSEDTVAVALCDLKRGSRLSVDGTEVLLSEDIPRGHKFALETIKNGNNVMKYGNPIGHATKDISAGAWVHTHNIATNLGEILSYEYQPKQGNGMQDDGTGQKEPERTKKQTSRLPKTFQGFRR